MSDTTGLMATIEAFLKAAGEKDWDTALPYISDDCEYVNIPMSKVKGPAGVRAVLEPFFAPTVENDLKVLQAIIQDDWVFTERLDRHRLPDKWVELPVAGVFQVKDGKITAWREYFDLATIMKEWPSA